MISAFALLVCPYGVLADPAPGEVAGPVLITEVQTGAGAAGDEFIELFNTGASAVDITGWQIRYLNAGGSATSSLVAVTSADARPVLLPAGSYYTLHSSSVAPSGAGQAYSAGLSKTDKTVALFASDPATCQFIVQDAVAWALPTAGATQGEGAPLDSTAVNTKEKLLQRRRDAGGAYIDTNDNSFDFMLAQAAANAATPGISAGATPGVDNPAAPASDPAAGIGAGSPLAQLDINGCVVVPPEPDPASGSDPSPGSDPGTESGADIGSDPTTPPDGDSPPTTDQEPASGSDPATTPDPETPPSNAGLLSPAITELLPDPAPPQSDDADEFVELYNPNDAAFDLSGYLLESGITTRHRFVFPAGAQLAPHTYAALFAADTGLTLTNSGGQVRLLDPEGEMLSQAEAYPSAKEAQAWALIDGDWQWTSLPTPNAVNAASPPAAAKVASVSTKAKSKPKAKAKIAQKAAAKSSKTAKVKSKAPGSSTATNALQNLSSVTARDPLHPGVLALVVAGGLLYGAYEYRRDVANRFYQFRSNRAARRVLRRGPEGR